MPDRLERLTNLVAALLATARPLTLEEIVNRVPGYPADKASYQRQFERDKEAVRGLGIPVRLEPLDAFSGELGYRVRKQDYELPDLDLTPDEGRALHVAVAAMHLEGGEGREAMWKLGGLGDADVPPLGALPSVPALPALLDASRHRATVTFRHRGEPRRLDPYALAFRGGHWYVLGHDHDRDEVRSFRADRIEGAVEVGPERAFERPARFDPDAVLHHDPWRYGAEPVLEAVVAIDATLAGWVVDRLGEAAVDERRTDGSVVVTLTVTNREAFHSYVLGLLDHAQVLRPRNLRSEIVGWLRAVAGGKR